MKDDFEHDNSEMEEWENEDEEVLLDPFEGLTKKDQDIFFRVLDLLPREQLEYAMEYFMGHPKKIHAVVDYVKHQKELIDNGDTEGLRKLFEQEQIVLDTIDQSQLANQAA